MPSVIESPSGRLPEKAPRWDLTGTEGSDGGKVFSWLFLVLGENLGIYRPKNRVRRAAVGPQARGRPPKGAPLWLVATRQVSCLHLQVWQVSSGPRKIIPKILFRLDSV